MMPTPQLNPMLRLVSIAAIALPASLPGNPITEIAPFEDFVADGSPVEYLGGFTYHDGTFYVSIKGSGVSQINKVTLGSAATNLADQNDFTIGFPEVVYGFGLNASGDLQFADSRRYNAIYRLTTDGTLTTHVSNDALSTYIHSRGVSTSQPASLIAGNRTRPGTDEFYQFEFYSEEILKIDGNGQISTLISQPQLIALTGTDRVDGGIAFSLDGTIIYWVSRRAKAFYAWDINQQLGWKILDSTQYHALVGSADDSIFMRDLYMAPDGHLYFSEGSTDYIFKFDPDDPGNTLAVVATKQELLEATGTDNVSQLGWYNGSLAFIIDGFSERLSTGIFWIAPDSGPRVTDVGRTPQGQTTIEFESEAGASYAVAQSATLQADWSLVPDFRSLPGTGGTQSITLPVPTGDASRQFYRIHCTASCNP